MLSKSLINKTTVFILSQEKRSPAVWKKCQDSDYSLSNGVVWNELAWKGKITARSESECKELFGRNSKTDCKVTEHWSFQPYQLSFQQSVPSHKAKVTQRC